MENMGEVIFKQSNITRPLEKSNITRPLWKRKKYGRSNLFSFCLCSEKNTFQCGNLPIYIVTIVHPIDYVAAHLSEHPFLCVYVVPKELCVSLYSKMLLRL